MNNVGFALLLPSQQIATNENVGSVHKLGAYQLRHQFD
jgi:hypothetical protein